jgi:hypothetical protein
MGTTACQEATEACLKSKEPTSVEVKSEWEHQEVLKEEAAAKTVKSPEEANPGSRKKLAAANRGMTRHAILAPRKGHGRQGQCCKRNLQRTDI